MNYGRFLVELTAVGEDARALTERLRELLLEAQARTKATSDETLHRKHDFVRRRVSTAESHVWQAVWQLAEAEDVLPEEQPEQEREG